MPPRGSNERLDFTPILTHYLFLFTSVFAVVSPLSQRPFGALWPLLTLKYQLAWFIAFIGQIVATADCEFPYHTRRV